MDKLTEYAKLAKEVNQCHFCEKAPAFPYDSNAEHPVKCGKDGVNVYGYVNLWNLWQGNLDAKVMVIGQDYGTFKSMEHELASWKKKEPENKTDRCLKNHIENVLSDNDGEEKELSPERGIKRSDRKNHLFFTNTVNCYRAGKSSGQMNSCWLPICANRFLGRLINIVSPKIIIVLGQQAFEALYCLETGAPVCISEQTGSRHNFSDIMLYNQYRLYLENGECARVFPVYHPSAEARNEDIKADSDKVWEKIKEYYKSEMPDC